MFQVTILLDWINHSLLHLKLIWICISPPPLSSPGSVGELPPPEHARIKIINNKYLCSDLIIDVI
jgi:hypothetical protein